jgi:PiT family inorganic phosphate transporter
MDIWLLLVIVSGFYVAWNIGANDTANAMATSVGSKVLTIKQAVLRDAILNFLGAVLFGRFVAVTVGKGIVNLGVIPNGHTIAIGALSVALAAGLWITLATWKRLPVSTTHAIVGAMFGFGLVTVGLGNINWSVIIKIVLSWITSPLFGAILGFIIFILLKKFVFERVNDMKKIEKVFGYFQILAGCFVSFSIGANDVANSVAPAVTMLSYGAHQEVSTIPLWILAIGGLGIVVGTLTWGYKVIETIGEKVTEITPSRGFSAEFSTACVVLSASYLGMPVSTTHTLVGAIVGVGVARGINAINLNVVKGIIAAWILTLPVAAVLSILIYLTITSLF